MLEYADPLMSPTHSTTASARKKLGRKAKYASAMRSDKFTNYTPYLEICNKKR